MTGEPHPAKRPVLAAACASGEVSAERAGIIIDCLTDLDKITDLDPGEIDQAEHELTATARLMGPEDLRRCATKMVDVLDPDGTLRDEKVAFQRRNLSLKPRRDGRYRIEGDLTAQVGGCRPRRDPVPTRPTPPDHLGWAG